MRVNRVSLNFGVLGPGKHSDHTRVLKSKANTIIDYNNPAVGGHCPGQGVVTGKEERKGAVMLVCRCRFQGCCVMASNY
ncbi:hypothetical protein VTI74DRAFT_9157 [Chaetomium olivicolor]